MASTLPLFPTSLVGSMPQPEWLIDRKNLAGRFPPRVRACELWRVAPEWLDQAQDDATLLAIRDQERAGLDIVDGEIRRESYSNRFATALDGVDLDNPGTALDRSGHPNPVPRVTGAIRRRHAVGVRDLEFLRRHTTRQVKVTVPGPFTMSQQAQIDHYGGSRELAAMDYAAAVNAEIRDLFSAGADLVQIDEPYMQARPEDARAWGLASLNRALEGVRGTTAVHICFGYAAIIHARPSAYSFLPELAGCRHIRSSAQRSRLLDPKSPPASESFRVISLGSPEVESAETVALRVRRALPFVRAEDIILAPDCGMKYLPREVAFGKLKSMVAGAAILRAEMARRTGPVRVQSNS
jgi:5-methyltetrahydropteroyltriglutamate--homocysteine methyltransferase